MPQIFHPSTNTLVAADDLRLAGDSCSACCVVCYLIMQSPYQTQVRVVRPQPVPFSHEHHVQRAGNRLPLLPHVGRVVGVCGPASDAHVHEVPLADLGE